MRLFLIYFHKSTDELKELVYCVHEGNNEYAPIISYRFTVQQGKRTTVQQKTKSHLNNKGQSQSESVKRAAKSQRKKEKREKAKDKGGDMYLGGIEIVSDDPPDVCV